MRTEPISRPRWPFRAASATAALALGLAAAACSPAANEGTGGAGAGKSGAGGTDAPAASGGTAGPVSTGGQAAPAASGGTTGIPSGGRGGGSGVAGGGGARAGGTGGAAPMASGGFAGSIVRGPNPTEASASMPGPYRVARYSTGLTDSPAYAGYDVDYPEDATPPFAGVAVIPGFIEGRAAVGDWGPFLASYGFAVITVDPNVALDPPATRAEALWAAIGSLKEENARSGSPLAGKVDTGRFAVMGHSMGGGATLETANAHSAELRAAIPLAPWDLVATFQMITVPTLILAGQTDAVAPVAQHAMAFYSALPPTTTRAYAEFTGGDHYVADSPVMNKGAAVLGLSWLKVYVEGDSRYLPLIKTRPELSSFLIAP